MKNQKGVTLVALIVTAIVMLILAGATILSIVGENGVIERARKASIAHTEEGEIEKLKLTLNELQMDKHFKDLSLAEKQSKLLEKEWCESVKHDALTNETIITIKGSGDRYLVDNENNITRIAGNAVEITPEHYGMEVDYDVEYVNAVTDEEPKWEIFYADDSFVYLITKGGLEPGKTQHDNQYTGSKDFLNEEKLKRFPAVAHGFLYMTFDPTRTGNSKLLYDSTFSNMLGTQFLLDKNKWGQYADSEYAKWAIGAPTLEMFVNSYNQKYDANEVVDTPIGNGYPYGTLTEENDVPSGTYLNHDFIYWIACPANNVYRNNIMRCLNSEHDSLKSFFDGTEGSQRSVASFRPIVCLNSDTILTKVKGEDRFTLSN